MLQRKALSWKKDLKCTASLDYQPQEHNTPVQCVLAYVAHENISFTESKKLLPKMSVS